MFSMMGLPPLGGFFGKLFVFEAAVDAGHYILAVIGVLTSVVAAYYYLRVIKLMYFDEPIVEIDAPSRDLELIGGVATAFITLFIIFPASLVEPAQAAAASLMMP